MMKRSYQAMAGPLLAMLMLGPQADFAAAETKIEDMSPAKICGRKLPNGQFAVDRDLLQKQLFLGIQSQVDWDALDENQNGSYEKAEIADYLVDNSGALLDFAEKGDGTGNFAVAKVPAGYKGSFPLDRARMILESPPAQMIIVCTGFSPKAEPKVAAKKPWTGTGDLRVRLDIKTLPIKLEPKTAKGNVLKPAVASLTENFKKGESTIQLQGVAGFAWESAFGSDQDPQDNPYQFIPYIGVHQRFNKDRPQQEIDILNGGFLFSAYLGANSGMRHLVEADAHFTSDSVGNTKVLSGSLSWSPFFDNVFGYVHQNVLGLFDVYFNSSLEVHVGEVFDDGGNDGLSEKGNFVRTGGRLSMAASGSEEGFLKDFEFTAGYIWLPNISGPAIDIERFEVGVAYYFDDLRRFGFGINYVNGNIDDTLEDVDYLEASLMFRL